MFQKLTEYKSVRNKIYDAGLEQENDYLRDKLEKYDAVIEQNALRGDFSQQNTKTSVREVRR